MGCTDQSGRQTRCWVLTQHDTTLEIKKTVVIGQTAYSCSCHWSMSPVCLQLHTGGIIIMKDTSEEDEELVESVSAHGPKIEEEEQEPEAPESFEYIDE